MKLVFLLMVSYMMGNFLTATVVGRTFYKRDIYSEGSGNPGARNAGRVLGKKAFILIFIGDACKGALAVMIAKWIGGSDSMQLLALLAVMTGHIYPAFFRFRGGKGVSAFIGGIFCFQPVIGGVLVIIFLLLYVFVKSFTIAGLGAIFMMPFVLFEWTREPIHGIMTAAIVCLLGFAHYKDLQKEYRKKGKR